ncbi:MAG TPA: hypothetical protein VFW44_02545, partial [Bryobacteraceae bacterium]|nr:hypothetical protein [Bryobacteraceae bacterium]
MESVESAYMAISRFASRHWGDLSWFPLWYTGIPFDRVYQPGLHVAVAALSLASHWPITVAYHFLTALAYCFGPVALFALCLVATRSLAFAFATALIYSLFSPISFLVPLLASDAGGYFHLRNLQILVHYGEGPHMTAVAILPLAVLFLHRALSERRAVPTLLTILAMAAIVITNWPGSIGLSLAIGAYLLAYGDRFRLRQWLHLALICVCAYALIMPWIPPSTILSVEGNAQASDGTRIGLLQMILALAILLACLLLRPLFRRLKLDDWTVFFLYFLALSGSVVLGYFWFDVRLLPQPHRFQPELQMALAGVIASAVLALLGRLDSRSWRLVASFAIFCACALQLWAGIRYAHDQIQPIDVRSRVEYRMAKAFERLEGSNRVFAPGNVSLWMNMFTNVPLMNGCCDQSIPSREHRIATYIVYRVPTPLPHAADPSILWLEAYGAHAIGVTGEHSAAPFRPFLDPGRFQG